MRRFERYSEIERDEIRKAGLRALSFAFKHGKKCVQCGWSNPFHLVFTATRLNQKPLSSISQSCILDELTRRPLKCLICRRLSPFPKPQYKWTACTKCTECVECGKVGQQGWSRVVQAKQIESARCVMCKAKFDVRVRRAKQINKIHKMHAKQCCQCGLRVTGHTTAAFDWDHLNRQQKTGNIGQMTMNGASAQQVVTEIAKCRLMCAHCHFDWTQRQLGYSDPRHQIEQALEKARIRTFNEEVLDLCESDEEFK